MSVRPPLLITAIVLWLAWCWLVVSFLVPVVLRHLTIWSNWTAYILCLLPVLVAAAVIISRNKARSSKTAQ